MKSHYHIHDLTFLIRTKSSDIPIIKEVIGSDNYQIGGILKPNDIVIDIGGHIGSFSVYAASMGATVITYEPVTASFELLQQNVEINGFPVDINKMAVTDKEGGRMIYIRRFNYGGSNLYHPHMDLDLQEMIQCTTLDKIYQDKEIDHCDFLKLDCEGAEFDIIKDFSRITSIKRIAVEFEGQERRSDLINLLSKTHKMVGDKSNDRFGTMIFEIQ